jgi:hypothetical protein
VKELIGLSKAEFIDSERYISTVKKSQNLLGFKMTFKNPWLVSANKIDILKIKICNQEFGADLIQHTNTEGCLELH